LGAPLVVGAAGVLTVGGHAVILRVGVVGLFLLVVVFAFQAFSLGINLIRELLDCFVAVLVGDAEVACGSVEEGVESGDEFLAVVDVSIFVDA
jgi:hypothetical protein